LGKLLLPQCFCCTRKAIYIAASEDALRAAPTILDIWTSVFGDKIVPV